MDNLCPIKTSLSESVTTPPIDIDIPAIIDVKETNDIILHIVKNVEETPPIRELLSGNHELAINISVLAMLFYIKSLGWKKSRRSANTIKNFFENHGLEILDDTFDCDDDDDDGCLL
jgi:hypothetical protein